MRNQQQQIVRFAALLTTVSFTACGGGGSSTNSVPAPVPSATLAGVPNPAPTATGGATSCASSSIRRGNLARSSRAGSAGINAQRLYVTYRASAATRATASIDRTVSALRVADFGVAGSVGHRVITLPAGTDPTAATATLRRSPDVVSVAPIHYRTLSALSSTVNDPLAENSDQWYLFKTNVAPGWATTHGSAAVSVAVIDTGVDETNPDFTFAFRESVINGVKTLGAGSVQDTNGHGTNVAGLATAVANNSFGYAGVGYNTPLQAYKIFPDATATSDCQTADTADEAQAIRDAVANGASVINLSLGSGQSAGADPAEQDAVAFAIASNVTVVAANGNDFPSADGNQPDFPGGYPGVIAVGASAVQNSQANVYASITAETIASYSNSQPTLVAPGGDASGQNDQDVLHWVEGYSTTTAKFAADVCTVQNGVCAALFNGTSQATPQVSGTVALMMANHGGARSLTPAQALALLTSTADVLPGISATRQGAGRLNIGNAVAAAHP